MRNFDYQTPTRLIFGKGVVENKLKSVMAQFGKRVLITYGGGSIKRSGLYDKVLQLLEDKEIKLYYERRTLIDKKPRHYVLNAIANKLLRIIFTLVEKGEYYDANFIRQDPRVVKYN